jgi:hypothetical protein
MNKICSFSSVAMLSFMLSACVSPYQAFNHSERKPLGYTEIKLSKANSRESYLLTYHGDGSKEQNFINWLQRASELCPSGYKVIQHETDIFFGSVRSPVNGMMVTLGTQQPIDRGMIQCSQLEQRAKK